MELTKFPPDLNGTLVNQGAIFLFRASTPKGKTLAHPQLFPLFSVGLIKPLPKIQ